MKLKERKDGFTLIELLVTIAILSFIIVVVTIGIINIINSSKDSSGKATEKGIKEAAVSYSNEGVFDRWQKIDNVNEKHEYFCVTIGELIKKGLLDNNKIDREIYPSNTYVAVIRDKTTKAIQSEEIVRDTSKEILKKVCTGNSKEVKNYVPDLRESYSYTDEIDLVLDYDKLKNEVNKLDDNITKIHCLYGESSSKFIEGDFIEDTSLCNFNGLKSETDYWARICVETDVVESACTSTEVYSTKNIIKPTISLNDKITISYDSSNIKGNLYRYFKSSIDGISDIYVFECDNNLVCDVNSTSNIKSNKWYLVNNDNININYDAKYSGLIDVDATIKDKTGNMASNKLIGKQVIFMKGNADTIDNKNTDISKICIVDSNGNCKITSPVISKTGYDIIGWNIDSGSLESIWNVGVSKTNFDGYIYYPIIKPKVFNINYYLGNSIVGSSSCFYGKECELTSWENLKSTFPNSKNGWKFDSWSISENSLNSSYKDNQKFIYDKLYNINLYALGSRIFNFYSGVAPTSIMDTQVQYWNPVSTNTNYLSSIVVPKEIVIDGWNFVGYKESDSANSSVTFGDIGSRTPGYNEFTNLDFRTVYSRSVTLSYDANNGSGKKDSDIVTQYYNSGYASSGNNIGSNISKPTFVLRSNLYDAPSNYKFSSWAEESLEGNKYKEGDSYVFSPKVTDTKVNKTMYAIWVMLDAVKPTCTISASLNSAGSKVILTVNGSDNFTSSSNLKYSWTGSTSGFSSTKTNEVSSNATYTAYVIDEAGNVNSCQGVVSGTSVSKYSKTTKTCGRTKSSVDCKGKFSGLYVCNSGSKCTTTQTSGKCECYSRTTSTRFCSSSYPNYDSTNKQCYKLDWQYSSVVKGLAGTGFANDQTDANKFCSSEWNKYTSGSGTSKIEYRNCSAYKSGVSWDQYWDCQCDKYTYNKKIYTSYSCTSGVNLGDGYCYTYSNGSCPSGSYRGSSSNNGDPDYCYDEGRASCGGGFDTLIRTNYNYAFITKITDETSCSTGRSFACDNDNKGNYEKKYVSSCTPIEYGCDSGTKLNNTYCYTQK